MSKLLYDVGYSVTMSNGQKATIINRKQNKIDIQFEDGTIIKNKNVTNFLNEKIKNPNDISVYGVGKIGETNKGNAKIKQTWLNMLERCYSEFYHASNPCYVDCKVCDEWLNYSNFVEWYLKNYYEIDGETMQLDKDILVKGNKIYSPETCVFVPKRINCLVLNRKNDRGKHPIGVYYHKRDKQFIAQVTYNNKNIKTVGRFYNSEDAFICYKEAKEKYIKEVADEYKDKIPQKLYEALYNWKIEKED